MTLRTYAGVIRCKTCDGPHHCHGAYQMDLRMHAGIGRVVIDSGSSLYVFDIRYGTVVQKAGPSAGVEYTAARCMAEAAFKQANPRDLTGGGA